MYTQKIARSQLQVAGASDTAIKSHSEVSLAPLGSCPLGTLQALDFPELVVQRIREQMRSQLLGQDKIDHAGELVLFLNFWNAVYEPLAKHTLLGISKYFIPEIAPLKNSQLTLLRNLGLLHFQVPDAPHLVLQVLNPLLVESLLRLKHLRQPLLQQLLSDHDLLPDFAEDLTYLLSLLLGIDLNFADVVLYRKYLIFELWLVGLGQLESIDEVLSLSFGCHIDVQHLVAFV